MDEKNIIPRKKESDDIDNFQEVMLNAQNDNSPITYLLPVDRKQIEDLSDPECPVSLAMLYYTQLPIWYPLFRKDTIRSQFIPLSKEIVVYLRADEMYFPPGVGGSFDDELDDNDNLVPKTTNLSNLENVKAKDEDGQNKTIAYETVDDEEEEEEEEDIDWINLFKSRIYRQHLSDLISSIKSALSKLGGNAVPKLNWTLPRDATWANGETLNCEDVMGVFSLLKSSSFLCYDLTTIPAYLSTRDLNGDENVIHENSDNQENLARAKYYFSEENMTFSSLSIYFF